MHKDTLEKLENDFNYGIISQEDLAKLVKLKYNSEDLEKYTNYKNYALLNLSTEIPDLSDADLGKFHRMIKATHKENNKMDIKALEGLFGISDRAVYKFLSSLKSKNIIKEYTKSGEKFYCINPRYVINGELNYKIYSLFKEDINTLFPNIPKEVINLWEYLQSEECFKIEENKYYVYRFLNKYEEVIYVGRTNNISNRIKQHLSSGHLPSDCYSLINKIEYIELETFTDILIYEIYYINKYLPIYNTRDKDELRKETTITLPEKQWKEYIYPTAIASKGE